MKNYQIETTKKPFDITIEYDSDNDRQLISARELHEALKIETPYHKWFPRMCEYGFAEGRDFNSDKNVRVQIEGSRSVSREVTDHQITIDMAKEICMIQRSDIGKKCREYFLEVEKKWNSPESIMARALQLANNRMVQLEMKIEEDAPKVEYYENVLMSDDTIHTESIAKKLGTTAQRLNKQLCDLRIQHKVDGTYVLNREYQNCGYATLNTIPFIKNGDVHYRKELVWTYKGEKFIHDVLNSRKLFK